MLIVNLLFSTQNEVIRIWFLGSLSSSPFEYVEPTTQSSLADEAILGTPLSPRQLRAGRASVPLDRSSQATDLVRVVCRSVSSVTGAFGRLAKPEGQPQRWDAFAASSSHTKRKLVRRFCQCSITSDPSSWFKIIKFRTCSVRVDQFFSQGPH